MLAEQSTAMEARLRAMGVLANSKLYRGATHSFLEATPVAAVAREGLADGAAFIRKRLA